MDSVNSGSDMGLLAKILGASNVVKDVGDAIDKVTTSDEERLELHQKWDALQTSVNIEEIKTRNLFISGWRPFLGWSFAIGISINVVLMPIVQWILLMCGFQEIPLPEFPFEIMMEVIIGMLGLGGLRSYEKQKGLTK